jgi:CheY-like chemotaxis protein
MAGQGRSTGAGRLVRAACRRCGAHLTAEQTPHGLAGHCSTCGSTAIELIPDAPVQDRATVKIFIVDDHPLIRRGVEQLLTERGHRVVGLASEARDVCAAIRATQADVVVVDLGLPEVSGAELIRAVRDARLPVRIVVYTAAVRGAELLEAVRAGADGLVSKNSPVSRLAEAVEAVNRGERFVDPELRDAIEAAYRQ